MSKDTLKIRIDYQFHKRKQNKKNQQRKLKQITAMVEKGISISLDGPYYSFFKDSLGLERVF